MIIDKNKTLKRIILLVMLLVSIRTVGGSVNLGNIWQVVVTVGIYTWIVKFVLKLVDTSKSASDNFENIVNKIIG